jgi:hypothetical protein
MMVKDSF